MYRALFTTCLCTCGPSYVSVAAFRKDSKRILAHREPQDISFRPDVPLQDDETELDQGRWVSFKEASGSYECRAVRPRSRRVLVEEFDCKCPLGLLPMFCETDPNSDDGSERCTVDGDRCSMHGKFQRETLTGAGCKCRTPPAVVQPKFDEEEARYYLEYARASFCTNYSLQTWNCGDACRVAPVVPGKVRHIVGPKKKGTGYVAQVPSTDGVKCIVAFRGSEDIENWIANFQFASAQWPPWCPACKVHYGFLQTYLEIRDTVHEALREFNCSNIALAGHSLGGAIAQLATIELRHNSTVPHVGPVWTFGMPRVGNPAFVGAFMWEAIKRSENPPLWRVVNFKDPVPHLPPTLNNAFRHPPTEVYYRKNSSFIMCPSSWTGAENTTCSYSHTVPISPDHMVYLGKTTVFGEMHKKCQLTPKKHAANNRKIMKNGGFLL